ncbi:MAG: N-(5'-phosphoribosyl)anthranilate isomerase [Pseudomonadota bacterium]
MSLPMQHTPLCPENYLLDMFSSRAARSGGVVRRKASDVDRYIGRADFLRELDRRGFRAIENAGQIIVFCNTEPVRVLT